MSSSPLSIAAPSVGSFMSEEVALFTPGGQSAGLSFIKMVSNLEIRERRLRTRAAWREMKLTTFPEEYPGGNTQGACSYDPRVARTPVNTATGTPGIIESSAGKMYRLNIGEKEYSVTDISNGVQGRPTMRIAWMIQALSYVIRTDEASSTQIWDGTTTFTSTGFNRDTPSASRLPNFAGPLAFGDRIWVVNNMNEVLAGDHTNRLDLIGNTDLLKFSDQSYDFSSTSFKAPLEMGGITSLNVVTSYRGGNLPAQAEIVVGTEGQGMWGILAGTPRARWGETSMRRIIHRTVAPTGPWASYASNDEMIFRTPYGLSSIKYISQETQQIGNPLTNLGQEIRPLLDQDPLDLLPFTSLYVSPRYQRLICTVWPVAGENGARWSRGYVSMALAPGRTRLPEAGVWEGVNTFPEAMGEPIQFVEVRDLDKLRLFALTRKTDGTKGLAEWTSEYSDDRLADGTAVRIPWQVHTRKLSVSGEMNTCGWGDVVLSVLDVRDRVNIKILARSRNGVPFRTVYTGEVVNKTWEQEKFGYADVEPMKLGNILHDFKDPWIEIIIQGEGCCHIDLAIMSASSGNLSSVPSVSPVCADGENLCEVDYFKRN